MCDGEANIFLCVLSLEEFQADSNTEVLPWCPWLFTIAISSCLHQAISVYLPLPTGS